ncbi:methyl-accepting chemotaxis protein [Pseudomonas syringae]|nr:methyl-accepting chemotaxis protein [Pseudomonas syringae]MBD8577303.1 methyl-accepting chemotaxis protein [Pseudomonas syringae]
MLSNTTIAQKLSIGFGVIILIICVLIGIARNGFSDIHETTEWNVHTYKVLDNSSALLISLTNIETGMRGFALAGQDDFLGPLTSGKAEFDKRWEALKQLTSDNPVQQKRLDQIKSVQQRWMTEDIDATLALRRAVVAGQGAMDDVVARIVARQDKVKMDGMRALIAELQEDEARLLAVRTQAMDDAASFANWSLIIGGLIAAAAALLIAISLSTSIRKRLDVAVDIASRIASGRLDTPIDATGSDEIGKLMTAFSTMQAKLREMMTAIKDSARQLLLSAQDISRTSEALSVSAQEQSHSASTMAATVEELTVSISHVASSANEAHAISTESGRQSTEGGAVIQNTLSSMDRIADTVQNSSRQIDELGLHIQQITSIVNVISEIAEQTNLLALNAAIEAARAGEQGRGFAVVADEVRLLAQRTGKSTSEISDMIKKIQASAQDAVAQMGVGVQQVNMGVQLANSANAAIEEIRGGSGRISGVVDQISVALNEQSAASQDVARNVERIAQMAQANSEGVSGASRSAADIERLAHGLTHQVDQFRL